MYLIAYEFICVNYKNCKKIQFHILHYISNITVCIMALSWQTFLENAIFKDFRVVYLMDLEEFYILLGLPTISIILVLQIIF